jgi:hypothetical protein
MATQHRRSLKQERRYIIIIIIIVIIIIATMMMMTIIKRKNISRIYLTVCYISYWGSGASTHIAVPCFKEIQN